MGYEAPTYYLVLRERGKSRDVLYRIGSADDAATVIRLSGKGAGRVFSDIVSALSSQGAVTPMSVSDHERVYSIREDLGPVVGAYLILVRRSRDVEKWSSFLRDLLEERYPGIAKALVSFLEVAIELSKSFGRTESSRRRRKDYTLSPVVLDALSAALKMFVSKAITKLKPG